MNPLDDVEALARDVVKNWDGMPSHTTAVKLARAVLAVMPVVRAAERLFEYEGLNEDTEAILVGNVVDAVDKLRGEAE